ncbi:hypothetical protein GCM10009655_18250 [Rhodoglobus aureus]|uniref:Uncharacterized protein n=1 Tax=Rhodoglobus aureus TaxID=191497 RepID=A0ABN1VPI8_9MICO
MLSQGFSVEVVRFIQALRVVNSGRGGLQFVTAAPELLKGDEVAARLQTGGHCALSSDSGLNVA